MNNILSLLQIFACSLTIISILLVIILEILLIYGLFYIYKCYIKKKVPKPKMVGLSILSQGETGMLKFVLTLPTVGVSDVVSRELTVAVGDVEAVLLTLSSDATESQEFEAADDTVVTGTLVDVDNAGNKSEAREFNFVIVDTIAPPQPGELGVKVISET